MGPESPDHVPQDSHPLDIASALRQTQQMLAAERESAERLEQVATKLISAEGMQALYEEILDALQAISGAHFASIQKFYPEGGSNGQLRLIGHRGFSDEAARQWEWVTSTTRTTCGEALRTARKVTVADVRDCDFMAGTQELQGYLDAGIRAIQTLPLISRSGALLGMVSTHWRDPHEPSATEVRALYVLARLAADLIERSRAEENVRESEERFRHIADTAPVMIWVSGPDNLGTFFNTAWLDFTGRTMEQELGEGWISSVHPDDLNHCLATCGASFTARQAFQIVFRLRRADGKYRWVLDHGAPRYLESEFAGYIGSCVDITDQKRVEEELRSNQVQLLDSQRLANVGSWELDIATGTTRWSEEWYRIFELPKDVRADFQTFLEASILKTAQQQIKNYHH